MVYPNLVSTKDEKGQSSKLLSLLLKLILMYWSGKMSFSYPSGWGQRDGCVLSMATTLWLRLHHLIFHSPCDSPIISR